VVLAHRPRGGGVEDGGREEKADVEEEEGIGEARDARTTEARIATTTATEPEPGALANND
jgi:hypothetical protein